MFILRYRTPLRSGLFTFCQKSVYIKRQQSQLVAQNLVSNDDYTEIPQYPPIHDLSFRSRKESEAQNWHEEIMKVPTVEEKMIKINMPRYYGYRVVDLHDRCLPYNCLPALQHYTRTVFEEMPSKISDEILENQVEIVRADIQDAIETACDCFRLKYPISSELDLIERDQLLGQNIVEHINRALINALAADYQHLQEVEVDYNPRHEAFWAVGGIKPPRNVVKSKEGHKWQKEFAKDPVDRLMQYRSSPLLVLRHRFQLAPWKDETEIENPKLAEKLPRYEFDPVTLGFTRSYRHGTNIAGYWPSNLPGFGYLSYQSRAVMQIRPASYGADDFKDAIHAQAIQSSFAWLLAQANYNGFNTYSELTYPMNSQTIVTNGRTWSFYEYQLNTLLTNSNAIDRNPKVNYCRGTEELNLYEAIDENGKIKGFNDLVLRQLIKFYTKIPNVQRSAAELQPYLNAQTKRIADYVEDEKRDFLDKTYKYLASNRPRHLELPEIYSWEKIYKIDNKMRPLEARRRFFELNINPWRRTLDQHQKEYIPKALRPEGPKSKKKWKPSYYP
uniref:Uncharacterized protein n=1 Tax=Glossina austeni TaxID=7395 RepID=A0A1A9VU90_GLOAU